MKTYTTKFRTMLAGLSTVALMLAPTVFAETFTEGKQVPPSTEKFKAGEFVWEPELAPDGPVLIVVSVPDQVAYVYRNGVRIARTSVSTGRPGHPTPVGVFNILEKETKHVSTIYKGAEMPFHGAPDVDRDRPPCGPVARIPGFARLRASAARVFEAALRVTQKGITVIIANEHSAPRETVHPGMLFSQITPPAQDAPLAAGETNWTPEKSESGPVTILFSSANKQVYVYRNGVEIGRAPLGNVGISGQHVYSALDGADAEGRRKWVRVDAKPAAHDPSFSEIAQRAHLPEPFIANMRGVVQPGSTMVFTDQAVTKETQSAPGFKVMGVGEVASR